MPNASHQPAAPVRARVHAGALARVTRFFTSNLDDIFTELLQNARRAGANGVSVATAGLPERDGGGIRVTVTDDGTGISDPAVLVSFGGDRLGTRPLHTTRMPREWAWRLWPGAVAACPHARPGARAIPPPAGASL